MAEQDRFAERLTNLTFALLGANGQYVSADWVRRNVAGYQGKSDEAFQKMFKRDRNVLLKIGVPIDSRSSAQGTLYSVHKDSYELPPLELSPEEARVLALAGGMGVAGELSAFARSGWTKLASAGAARADAQPGVGAMGDAGKLSPTTLDRFLQATRSANSISFDHRGSRRRLDPWGLVSHRQRLYMVGFDLDRDAPRSFRATRVTDVTIEGPITHTLDAAEGFTPPGIPIDPSAKLAWIVDSTLRTHMSIVDATLVVRDGTAAELTRWAQRSNQADDHSPEGFSTWTVRDADRVWLCEQALAYCTSVEIIDPPELREHMRTMLQAVADAHDEPLDAPCTNAASSLEARAPQQSKVGERLSDIVRMLSLLPYFDAHPQATAFEAARDLGMTPQQVVTGLERLWCCGPGPVELIDMEQPTFRRVAITDDQGMNRPLRLTRTEAAALLLALDQLSELSGDTAAIRSAATKIRAVADWEQPLATILDRRGASTNDADDARDLATLNIVRDALDTGYDLECDYYSASKDTTTARRLAPLHLFAVDGAAYVRAWDYDVADTRTFRISRMSHAQVGANPIDRGVIGATTAFNPARPFGFEHSEQLWPTIAHCLIEDSYTWIADFVPMNLTGQTTSAPDGSTLHCARINYTEQQWLTRFILRSGGQARVYAPDTARRQVLEHAHTALKAYTRGFEGNVNLA